MAWYFVFKIVLTNCEKKMGFEAEGLEFANVLKLLEQFIQTMITICETEHFFNLLTDIPQI